MNKLLLMVLLLISFEASTKPVFSGIGPSKDLVYYDDDTMVSYGRTVMGTTTNTQIDKTTSKKSITKMTHLYLCNFDELQTLNISKNTYNPDNSFDSNFESTSSTYTSPLSLQSSANIDGMLGYNGYRQKLKSKCSNLTKKLPRIEVSYFRTDSYVSYVLLDTLKTQGNIKSMWIKEKSSTVGFMKNEDGSDYEYNGDKIKEYTLVKNGKYKMVEYQVDCKNIKASISNVTSYDEKGNVISNESYSTEKLTWFSIVPNTYGEATQQLICGI